MMQLCSSLLCIVILWWTSSCFGAAVDAPNAERPKNFAAPETAGPDPPSAAATGLAKVKAALEVENENFVGSKTTNTLTTTTTTTDNVNDVFRETKSGEAILSRRLKRSFAPTETLSPANRRYRRSMGSTWKRRPWRPSTNIDDDYLTSQPQSSFPESGSLIYLVSSSSSSDINNNQQNSFQQSDPDKKDCSERKFPSEDSSSPFEDAFSAEEGSPTHVEEPRRQALKRVDRSSTSDMLASAGQNIARNFMKRRRGGRMYDVPQIECPRSNDRMERFACPSPDFRGRFRCIDDRSLCDGFFDCPGREDENPDQCLFYKTTKAHLDILAEALLRWARGR